MRSRWAFENNDEQRKIKERVKIVEDERMGRGDRCRKVILGNCMTIENFNGIGLMGGCCERCRFLLVMLLGAGGCDRLNWEKRWGKMNFKKKTTQNTKKRKNKVVKVGKKIVLLGGTPDKL
jgi:hypothetical protein